jgi:hypothetical protein
LDFFLWGYVETLIYSLPVGSEEDLTAHIIEAVATIRQNMAFFSAHIDLCWVIFSFLVVLVAICLNICSKLVKKYNFLRMLQCFFLTSSNLTQAHSDSQWHCGRTSNM